MTPGKSNLKILITGGSGLLAGRLILLLSENNIVTTLSRKNLDNIFNNKSINIKKYKSFKNLEKVIGDSDVIIHASGPNASDCNNSDIVSAYYNETKYLIDIASKSKCVKKFIFLSSIRAVSDNCKGIVTENTNLNPSSEYGKLKCSIEHNLLIDKNETDMTKIVLRITNGYGVPASLITNCWDLVVFNVCKQAVENKKIILKSKGEGYKDFIPISAVTNVIKSIISDTEYRKSDIFNVSSSKSIQVIDFIKLIKDKISKKLSTRIPIETGNLEEGKEHNVFTVDNSKITNEGWLNSYIDHEKEMDDLVEFCLKYKEKII